MAQFDLYIDTYSGNLVTGIDNITPASLPKLVQGDTISFRIYLLARTTSYPRGTPFTTINLAALSLKVGIGPKDGTAGSTLYTQQFVWAKDPTNSYFFADLPLNTAGITNRIGALESNTAWFEVEYTQNGFPTTVFQESVNLHAEVVETGNIVAPAGETAASVEYVNATFLKNENNGFILKNNNTGVRAFVYLADDGTLKADPIP